MRQVEETVQCHTDNKDEERVGKTQQKAENVYHCHCGHYDVICCDLRLDNGKFF